MTKEALNSKLDDLISWRKQEMENLKLEINSSQTSVAKNLLLRGGFALLYAHWEGSVKDLFITYNASLNNLLKSKKIVINESTYFILYLLLLRDYENLSFKNIICSYHTLFKLLNGSSISFEKFKEIFIKELEAIIGQDKNDNLKNLKLIMNTDYTYENLRIVSNVVNTESNLGFDVLQKLCYRFNINLDEQVLLEKQRINQVLKYRNDIAHGDNTHCFYDKDMNKLDEAVVYFSESITKIFTVVEYIKTIIVNNYGEIIQ